MTINKVVIYRDLEKENQHGFEIRNVQPDNMVLKEQIIPGAFGLAPLYIRHLYFHCAEGTVMILSQTDYELSDDKKEEILVNACQLLEKYIG